MVARWLGATRPRTWPASLAPVLVGIAAAGPGRVDAGIAVLTLFAALALQIASNLANDYADAESGVDGAGRLGPVRATNAGLLEPHTVKRAAYLCLFAALLAGIPLVARGGVPIVVIGLGSILTAVAYSGGPWPLASRGLGELMAFSFFGVVAVTGTAYLQTGVWLPSTFAAGAAVGSYAAAIMLVNNLRDIPTDGPAGKRTLAVRIGAPRARGLYGLLLAFGFMSAAVTAALEAAVAPLLSWGAIPLAIFEARAVAARTGTALNASLAGTARLEVVFGLLFALGLWLR